MSAKGGRRARAALKKSNEDNQQGNSRANSGCWELAGDSRKKVSICFPLEQNRFSLLGIRSEDISRCFQGRNNLD